MFALSSVGGPVLGGFLTEHLDWSLIFWINLPLGLAALRHDLERAASACRFIRASTGSICIGALLMMAAAVALLLALSWGGRRFDWISPQFGALLLASAVLWGLFAWRLVSTAEPFLPLSVLGNPVVRCAALAGACAMGDAGRHDDFRAALFRGGAASLRQPVRPGADPADGRDGGASRRSPAG